MGNASVMLDSGAMSSAPVAIIDVLNGLLEGLQNSLFRFLDDSSPYLTRATVELRGVLTRIAHDVKRQSAELASTIESLGGYPSGASILPEEQYLAYLSIRFLVPKLIEAKQLMITRFETALKVIDDSLPEVKTMLQRQLGEHQEHLRMLNEASAQLQAWRN